MGCYPAITCFKYGCVFRIFKISLLSCTITKMFLVKRTYHLLRQLYFILVPSNEKKSIQLLQDMRKSPPLQGMRLEEGDGNAALGDERRGELWRQK